MKRLSLLVLACFLHVSELSAGETITFLEEHHVPSGTAFDFGARYVVPKGKKATVTGFFCWVGVHGAANGAYNVQVAIVIDTPRTVRGPKTPWMGMNPISCSNAPGMPTAMSSGATVVLYPGDTIQAFSTNMSGFLAFVNASAVIHEEDL